MNAPVPGPPPGHVHRARITQRLDEAARAPLAVVAAPAGWGKTVAIADWARERAADRPVYWIDAAENPERLYDIAPSASAVAGRGPLAAPGHDILVVDSVNSMADPRAGAALGQLVARAVGRRSVVLAGRGDPAGALHHSLREATAEVSTTTLALTADETALMLAANHVASPIPARDPVFRATEGWAVGIRLAALALLDGSDAEVALNDGGPFDETVTGYLVAEVLRPLRRSTRELLLATAVVPLLTAALVEALTGRADGGRAVDELSRAGAFLARREGPGGWYRYHPAFGRAVHGVLRQGDPARAARLHQRAARWHVTYGLPTEAVRHSLLAGDVRMATNIVEHHWADLAAGIRFTAPYATGPTLPNADHAEPDLSLAFAAERLAAGDLVGVDRYVRAADRSGRHQRAAAAFRAAAAGSGAGASAAVASPPATATGVPPAVRALADVPDHDHAVALIRMVEGSTRIRTGELSAGRADLRAALSIAERSGMVHTQIVAASRLAIAEAANGQLREATRLAYQSLAMADRFGVAGPAELGWARLALAHVSCERGRTEAAGAMLADLGEPATASPAAHEPDLAVATLTVRARLCASAGRPGDGLELIRHVRQLHLRAPLAAAVRDALTLTEAELLLAVGEPAAARRLLDGDRPPFAGWRTVVRAAVLLAEGRARDAMAELDPVLQNDTADASSCRVHAGLTGAAAGRRLGDLPQVLRGLAFAVDAATAEDIRRPFVTGSGEIADLLATHLRRTRPARPAGRRFVGQLLETVGLSKPALSRDGAAAAAAQRRYRARRYR